MDNISGISGQSPIWSSSPTPNLFEKFLSLLNQCLANPNTETLDNLRAEQKRIENLVGPETQGILNWIESYASWNVTWSNTAHSAEEALKDPGLTFQQRTEYEEELRYAVLEQQHLLKSIEQEVQKLPPVIG